MRYVLSALIVVLLASCAATRAMVDHPATNLALTVADVVTGLLAVGP